VGRGWRRLKESALSSSRACAKRPRAQLEASSSVFGQGGQGPKSALVRRLRLLPLSRGCRWSQPALARHGQSNACRTAHKHINLNVPLRRASTTAVHTTSAFSRVCSACAHPVQDAFASQPRESRCKRALTLVACVGADVSASLQMMTDSRSSARRGEQDSKIASPAAARRSQVDRRSFHARQCFPVQAKQTPGRSAAAKTQLRRADACHGMSRRRAGAGRREVSVASLASIIQLQQPWVRLLQPMEALAVWIGAQQRLQRVIRGIASVKYTQVTERRSMSLFVCDS
jgi:hypothetical protein